MRLAQSRPDRGSFSLDAGILDSILRHARPLGHHEDRASLNIGFGFLYYGLVRALRPRHIVVVGSGYGFSVVCLALGLKDNGAGHLSFVDPSYSVMREGLLHTVGGTAQWDDPERVRAHFARFGVEDRVLHYRETSEAFFEAYERRALPPVDIAFIDGNHAYDAVQHDFMEALARCRRNSYLLLHDTNIYMRELVRHAGVKRWLNRIAGDRTAFEIVDFPFSSGVAVVRVVCETDWRLAG